MRMSEKKKVEILCAECGRESLLVRKPKYEGLKKIGEDLACASCGHVYEREEEVPYKEAQPIRVFDESDRPEQVTVFEEGENLRICRYCMHYVVNPFTQWCGLHKKEVAATDTCDRFSPKEASSL